MFLSKADIKKPNGSSSPSNQKTIRPRVLAENEGYSLLLVPVTIGLERVVRFYIYGLKSEEANALLAQNKQECTLLDFKGERPIDMFESLEQITDTVIQQIKTHFTSRFLSEQRMRSMKI